jgi:hypothetical protein
MKAAGELTGSVDLGPRMARIANVSVIAPSKKVETALE